MSLVLLPGLGADARLFRAQEGAFDFVVPAWPVPDPSDTLATYASRIETPSTRPLVVGGASFGGMLAVELARIHRADALVLIGSAREESGLHPFVSALAPFASFAPAALLGMKPPRFIAETMARYFGAETDEHVALFADMLFDASPAFTSWAVRAAATWRAPPLDVAVHAIHGARDRVIPAPSEGATLIDDAGHLLMLTHAERVNEFVRAAISIAR